jgi:tetratricopeptide (TPR) repeat protein
MKQLTLLIALLSCAFYGNSQPLKEENYQKGLDLAKAGKYEEAIMAFTKAIEVQPLDAYAWYNRAMAKNMIGEYETAIDDFTTCIGLSRSYEKVWYNRGLTKMHVGQYDGALFDLNQALQIQRNYPEANYYRAYIYELKGLYEFACTDYQNAAGKGYKVPSEKLLACQDTNFTGLLKNPLLKLSKISKRKSYGTKENRPIAIGSQENVERYLRLLRSPEGKFVPFEIKNRQALTVVKITYPFKGKTQEKTLYFDLNKPCDPLIIKGFKTFKELPVGSPP